MKRFDSQVKLILTDPRISVGAKALYSVLCSYADATGVCYPGIEKLAGDLGCSTRQVTRWMGELQQKQLIRRFWSHTPGGNRTLHTRLL